MRTARIAAAMAATLAALGAASTAHGAYPAGNLVVNPGAEDGPAPAGGCSGTPTRPGWTADQNDMGSCSYSYGGGYPTSNTASPGGSYFFVGSVSPVSRASQIVDVSGAAPEIDAGKAGATLAADLGGFGGQDDFAIVKLVYRNGSSSEIGTPLALPKTTNADRGGQTKFLRKSAHGQIPVGTRTIKVEIIATGGASNDGYTDNIELTLSDYVPPPPPPPPPSGGTTTTTPPPPATTPPVTTTPPRPLPPPRTPSGGSAPPAFGPNGVIQGLPSNKQCVSKRSFRIRLRKRKGRTYVAVNVSLNGKRVIARRGRRVTAPIDLRGLPRGRFTVDIRVVTDLAEVIQGKRTYRTCEKKRGGGRPGPL